MYVWYIHIYTDVYVCGKNAEKRSNQLIHFHSWGAISPRTQKKIKNAKLEGNFSSDCVCFSTEKSKKKRKKKTNTNTIQEKLSRCE